MKTIEKRIADLEASNVFSLHPVEVQIVVFSDKPLGETKNYPGVNVSYVRYEDVANENQY
jgi:hypothetical protein